MVPLFNLVGYFESLPSNSVPLLDMPPLGPYIACKERSGWGSSPGAPRIWGALGVKLGAAVGAKGDRHVYTYFAGNG